MDEANPGWYSIAADGTYTKNFNAENATWRAAMSGMDLIPTIKNYLNGTFDGSLVSAIVNDPAKREFHAETLTQLVVTQAFDGIDVDYESLPSSARDGFTQFVALLAQKLHRAGKTLSVTVHAKTSDGQTWPGPGAQDYAQIGRLADTVKIMAYDKHWSGSDAGAIAPLDWLEQVASYAIAKIPAGKVMIGLPWYGYDWLGKSGKSVTYKQAMDTAATNGAPIDHDANGEATFSYSGRTVFFQDAESYRRKTDLLVQKFPSVAGFAHWRIGAEDPEIWQKVGDLRGSGGTTSGGTGATKPAPSFSISGPTAISVTAGQTATASYSVVPVNGFSTPVNATVQLIDAFSGTAAFTTTTLQVGTPGQLRVSIDPKTAAGSYRIVLRFVASSLARELYVSVTVKPAPEVGDFTVSGPATLAVRAGLSSSATYRVTPSGGFDRAVAVSVEKIDAFAGSMSLSASTVAANGSSTLQVNAGGVLPGSYRVRLRFTSGSKLREQMVTVTVLPGRNRSARR